MPTGKLRNELENFSEGFGARMCYSRLADVSSPKGLDR